MIIKSMARKTPGFRQLLAYFHKEAEPDAPKLSHNLWEPNELETISAEFETNFAHLPPRANGNALYHEILALEPNRSASIPEQLAALEDLGRQYLAHRAPEQLAYGVIHREKQHLHLHLMISSNAVEGRQRVRLSKARFAAIQRALETCQAERYPHWSAALSRTLRTSMTRKSPLSRK